MATQFGVLIHGAGWVSTQHIAAFENNPRTKVLAICSRTREGAERRARESRLAGVGLYDDLSKALTHPGVEIVSICTPQHLHCANVLETARAGKHMVIEKPVANSRAELAQMLEAVRSAGVRTVVSFVLRWNPLFRTLKAMMADGAIGRPYYVEADYLSHNGSWWSGWRDARTVEQGISALLVGGCHAVDAARWFACADEFGAARPVEVFAMAGGYRKGATREYNPLLNVWVEDAPPMEYDGLEAVLIRFANGSLGKVTVNADCIMPYRFPLRVFGDRGTFFDNRVWSHEYPGQTDWVELPTICPDSSDVTHHPFQAEIDHFVDCLLGQRESHCNLEDAALTHEVVYAALESERTRLPVAIS